MEILFYIIFSLSYRWLQSRKSYRTPKLSRAERDPGQKGLSQIPESKDFVSKWMLGARLDDIRKGMCRSGCFGGCLGWIGRRIEGVDKGDRGVGRVLEHGRGEVQVEVEASMR